MLKVDVVESVRLSEHPGDERQVAERWRAYIARARRSLLTPAGARIVHRKGDGMLLAARDVPTALKLAQELHDLIVDFNHGVPRRSYMYLRIGIHHGPVLVDRHDLYGRGVNLAARLKDLADPGQTVCSSRVRELAIDDVDAWFEDLGECHLKHLRTPVRAFRVLCRQRPRSETAVQQDRNDGRMAPPDTRELTLALAVIPLDTVASTTQGQWAGELFADALIASLSKGLHLRLISRMSTRSLAHRKLPPQQLGRLVGAHFVLSGQAHVAGRAMHALLELADVTTGEVAWAGRVAGSTQDLLSGESELVAGTAEHLAKAIEQRELSRARLHPMPNLSSYALLLGGIALMHRFGRVDFQRARACLEALTSRAPRHAQPHAWLARWHVLRVVQGWSADPRADWQEALIRCERALELDPGSALAMTVEGSIRVRRDKDLAAAMRLYRQALDQNPSEPLAELLLGTAHTFKGEGRVAVAHAERAIALTPLDPTRFFYDSHAAAAHLTSGNLTRAIELAQRSLRLNRMHFSTLHTLGIAQALAGQLDEARLTVAQIRDHEPHLTARAFLERSPGGQFEHAQRYAEALARAGLPLG